ncbi:cytochrome P450 [Amylocystis lapponica]|nr:cytochrome P450 [Amylocystis lapponica]
MSVSPIDIIMGASAVALVLLWISRRRKLPLPPGPKGVPVLGNVFGIPKTYEWLAYQRWGREFNSDLIYLNLCGTSVIVVNSIQAACDLFEHKSAIYSGRPYMTMLSELMGFEWHFGFLDYGHQWKERRRAFYKSFNPSATAANRPIVLRHVQDLLRRLLDTPQEYESHISHMAGAIILEVTYGLDIKPKNDPFIETAERASHALCAAANSGAYLVDSIPILKYLPSWFPGAMFKRQAREWRKLALAMVEAPFNAVKSAISVGGKTSPSMISSFLSTSDAIENLLEQEKIYSEAAGAAYIAGTDTTISSVASFFLAMLLYPEVQRKVQEEIDRVVGLDRLPEFSDEQSLPYVTAVVKEVLRWQPVAPLGIAHRLSEADHYKGYHLPAGSIVIGNIWAMLHDSSKFPAPERFVPERHLDADGMLYSANEAETTAFGFGRRICPGRHLAFSSVWITVASVLATFTLVKPRDKDGNTIEPDGEYVTGLVVQPPPFKCAFEPRSHAAEALIRSTDLALDTY